MFLEVTHMDLNICLDTGHANMNEGLDTAFRLLKSRIRSTHVHDNDSKEDSHLFPLGSGGGTIDWRKAMASLRALDPQVPLLFEVREVADAANPLDGVRETFERLEDLKEPE